MARSEQAFKIQYELSIKHSTICYLVVVQVSKSFLLSCRAYFTLDALKYSVESSARQIFCKHQAHSHVPTLLFRLGKERKHAQNLSLARNQLFPIFEHKTSAPHSPLTPHSPLELVSHTPPPPRPTLLHGEVDRSMLNAHIIALQLRKSAEQHAMRHES